MEYTITEPRTHYTVESSKLDYTVGEQLDYTVQRQQLYYEAKDT